ncbi:hypothetical protein SDC9_85488 [bioreactor metagenome]|uniref:Uncharacterized protein n=1 Tax=bioreactor metagenome TaxID=1076179 RepID=A0A644ZEY2_9ZZZZ
MDGIGTAFLGGLQYRLLIQIALQRGAFADADGRVGLFQIGQFGICRGMHGNRFHAELVRSANHARCHGSTVCHQNAPDGTNAERSVHQRGLQGR